MKIFSPTISGSSQTSGSLTISGSLNVSQGITGSLLGTASWATNVVNGGGGGSTNTGSLLTTASVVLNTITFTKGDGSTFPITVNTGSGGGGGSVGTLAQVTALGASTTVPITASIISASSFTGSLFGTSSWALSASNAINARTASFLPVGTYSITSSWATNALTASLAPSYVLTSVTSSMLTPYVLTSVTSSMLAPYTLNSQTSSFVRNTQTSSMTVLSSSFAATASFINNLNQNLSITGAVVISGSSLPELKVIGDTQFTGSINSLNGYTGSLFGTASFATTASHALNGGVTSISAGSGISINQSTGNVTITNTGGGGGATFPYTGSAIISGSLIVTGSTNSSGGFTGSLFGTASHAITASYALSSAGGGGSFSLAGATDVSFSALADGDLIRYNGIAGKWQNTNLGLTLTPSLSMDSTFYFPGRATIVNYSSYSLASVFAEVKVGSTLIASNSQVTKNGSLLTWNDSSALTGSRTLYVQVQDFGDVASEIVTASYARELATFRYFRFYPTASTDYTLVANWRLYTSASQTGTSYPANMTNSGSPAPYFATASYFYTGYEPWKTFDNNTTSTGWWNLAAPNYSNTWLQIDLGSEITIRSIGITYGFSAAGYANFTRGEIYGSNSSSFETGQIKIASFAGQVAQTFLG